MEPALHGRDDPISWRTWRPGEKPRYCNPQISYRAHLAWATLSQAGHHHSYEVGLTAAELRRLRDEVQALIPRLRPADARPTG
jgi:hypothetical protein